ncbi:sensor histidine kinase [Massilia orientalis]|uniref:ATP-binding protein n=1 Tax=Massilia orientalis TaxID=3050128 RepID=A0ACC7M6A3_9BURK|nr:ATP-binding protein [Massilia sp. YIM B02787]
MPLRFLLLDDNPDDRLLARRELERHFPGCRSTEVGDRAGFEQVAAAGFPFDLVITDYQMRWTTGLDVLKLIKAHVPQLSVIMFTATGTQEIAVEAMKHGLDDYVIKSPRHYARLPVAVRTCLDRTEIRSRAIRSETRLASLLENIQVGVFRMSLEGEMEEGNRAFWSMLGLGSGEFTKAAHHPLIEDVRQHIPELKATLDAADLQLDAGDLDMGGRAFKVRLVRVRVNGHDAVDGIVDDVTSLRRAELEILRLNADLEQRIATRTRQLQDANEALETFGFSVSHDMREPLRTIQGYANVLKQDFAEGHLDKASLYIGRIEAVAHRVDTMVTDLLEFARLSRTEIATENVVVNDALHEVTAALHAEIQQAKARLQIEVPDDLTVRAHRQTVVQALTNLVSNAVKFVRPGAAPVVRIAASEAGSMVRVTVSDNGIGIAPAAQARIFNVFERLHSEEEYPGTGIGLAIVKKGVERMGGRVAVESAPGGGATFVVDLPAPPEPV